MPSIKIVPAADGALDLILDLASLVDAETIARHARFGLARFIFGECNEPGNGDAGVDEVLRGDAVISVRLTCRASSGEPVLQSVETIINTHQFSAGRTREFAARHAVPLLSRLGRLLQSEGEAGAARLTRVGVATTATGADTAAALSSPRRAGGLLRLVVRYARYLAAGRRMKDQWMLAFHRAQPAAELSDVPQLRLSHYQRVVPPPDRFWADPFPLRIDGRDYLLIEELLYAEAVGHLSVLELGDGGPLGAPVTVLQRPFHLSYPFTFWYRDELYLLPEMAEEGRLELYRAVRPPYEWVLESVIMEGPMLIDATVQEIDGRWWLFACENREPDRPWTDLLLFHADSPLGPWTAHPCNPVVSDVRCARPAGRLFRHDGVWIRPAQDCSRTYGGAITLRRIVALTPTTYHEEAGECLAVGTPLGMCGPHTLNSHDGLSAIDFKRTIRR